MHQFPINSCRTKMPLMVFSFIFIILGWFWNFLIISVTDLLLTGSRDKNLLFKPRFSTRLSKYDFNVSEFFVLRNYFVLFCYSCYFIVANLVREKRFCSFSKLFIIRNISYIEAVKAIFLSFSKYCNTVIYLFVVSLFILLRFCIQEIYCVTSTESL